MSHCIFFDSTPLVFIYQSFQIKCVTPTNEFKKFTEGGVGVFAFAQRRTQRSTPAREKFFFFFGSHSY